MGDGSPTKYRLLKFEGSIFGDSILPRAHELEASVLALEFVVLRK